MEEEVVGVEVCKLGEEWHPKFWRQQKRGCHKGIKEMPSGNKGVAECRVPTKAPKGKLSQGENKVVRRECLEYYGSILPRIGT